MPIDLSNLTNSANLYLPKFFDASFGYHLESYAKYHKSMSLANKEIKPFAYQEDINYFNFNPSLATRYSYLDKNTVANTFSTNIYIKLDPFYTMGIKQDVRYRQINLTYNPNDLGFGDVLNVNQDYIMRLTPHILRIKNNYSNRKHDLVNKNLNCVYLLEFYRRNLMPHDQNIIFEPFPTSTITISNPPMPYDTPVIGDKNSPLLQKMNECNCHQYLDHIPAAIQSSNKLKPGHGYRFLVDEYNVYPLVKKLAKVLNFNFDYIRHYLDDYDLADHLAILSKAYQTNLVKYLDIYTNVSNLNTKNANVVMSYLSNMKNYKIPLDQYTDLFKYLNKNYQEQDIKEISDFDLNLKFDSLLTTLKQTKKQLATLNTTSNPKLDPNLSIEQINAIQNQNPLTLVEAGAGTGKSHVILNRIKYLLDNNINSKDILVLSFTNAAADHIKDLYPGIISKTSSKLINQIYKVNFPSHRLINDTSFYNILKANSQTNAFYQDLLKASSYLTNPRDQLQLSEGFRIMSNLFEQDAKRLINILNTYQITTLNIQVIAVFSLLDKLTIPQNALAKYILVDEVQDNSIFDFLFLLKYTIVNKANLFIVGDASQTLYAFRNANPQVLNVLENSQIFDNFKLETNFRSRQTILSLANVLLSKTMSNRFAKIQLKSNTMQQLTKKDYTNTVQLIHTNLTQYPYTKGHRINKLAVQDAIANSQIINYTLNCLKKKQKVAFLCYSHQDLNYIQQVVKSLIPKQKLADISSKHLQDFTEFSNFWSRTALSDLMQYPSNQIIPKIKNNLVKNSYLENYWNQFLVSYQVQLSSAAKMTTSEFINTIKRLMINFEIDLNYKLQVTNSSNNTQAEKVKLINQSEIIFSTIHSSKGLEFDNTVVFINSPYGTSEEEKRTYYVALTRAKNSEIVAIFDKFKENESPFKFYYQEALSDFQ